jgi:GntR family transcriptional regulator
MTEPDTNIAMARIAAAVDPKSPVPMSVQLRGALEYGIATGDIPANTRLPSVRRLAASLTLSPVTVSAVYAALQERGHIEGRIGSGTFVANHAPPLAANMLRLAEFERQIKDLIHAGQQLGLSRQDIAFRLSMATPPPTTPVHILFLGTFLGATSAYAADLQRYLAEGDSVTAVSIAQITQGDCPDADLLVCPHTLTAQAARLCAQLPVLGLTLIPNEPTRIALARIAPEATVAAVSYFDDFLPTLKSGVTRFAPHVGRVTTLPLGFDDLPAFLAGVDVLIYSTGAEHLRDTLRQDQQAIEYRHTPDSSAVQAELLPMLNTIRTNATRQEHRDENNRQQLGRS